MDWPTNADLVLIVFSRIIGIVVSAATTIFALATATGESNGTAGALGAGVLVAGLGVSTGDEGCG
jgi:hypothetical protein